MRLQKAEEDLKKRRTSNSSSSEEDNPQVSILTSELERLNKALEFKDKEIERKKQATSNLVRLSDIFQSWLTSLFTSHL